jgi:5-methylcytosine-specific restriction protein A
MTWAGSSRRARLPKDWSARRRRVLDRDGWQCTWLTQGWRCGAKATEVDHIVNDDNHDESNLRSLCHPHHVQATARQSADARRKLGTMRRPAERHPGLR